MDTSTTNATDLPTNIDDKSHSDHPLHVTLATHQFWEADIPSPNTQHPYRYILLRKWDCTCTDDSHKKRTLHFFRLNSHLGLGYPDSRAYSVFRQLGLTECEGEPPHAQRYREEQGYEEGQLLNDFPEGSVSDVVDWMEKLYNGEIVLDDDEFRLCDCDEHSSPHAPHPFNN
jgi:hypothetical protein